MGSAGLQALQELRHFPPGRFGTTNPAMLENRTSEGNAGERMHAAMTMLESPVPPVARELIYQDGHLYMARDRFWFESPGLIRFYYQVGGQVLAELTSEDQRGELELYLWGTVYGAVAWYNGLLPVHASAVSSNDRVIAFSADSGGGKSTLAAGLTGHGYAHFCDDTLIVDPGAELSPLCIPDGKPLKLWSDALGQLPVELHGPVATVPDKFYARVSGAETRSLPLSDLVFLEFGETHSLEPIVGSAKLERLPDAMYRNFIHAARGDRDFHTATMLRLAQEVRFWKLTRPRATGSVNQTIEQVARQLRVAGM